ncbi:MAG: hypothetical protein JXR03_03330 [Cyclobacteriaceae bacterium]
MKYILILIAGLTIFTAQAQDEAQQAQDSIPYEFNRQAYIYQLAKGYNDPVIARMALYNLLSYNTANTNLLDTLALMYFDYNQMASAALTAQDAATINENDLFATEIAAVAFERLGVYPKAIPFYEKLYTSSLDINTLYKLAFLQMQSKNFVEASTNADGIIESTKSDEFKLLFPKNDKENQEVSLKAAAYRLKGLIEESQGNISLAKDFYQKALDMEPEFQLVKDELAALNK